MKKLNLFFVALAFCFSTSLSAQLELKINPIGILFNSPDLGIEYVLTDDIGVEAIIGLDYGNATLGIADIERSGYKIRLAGKYYFSPQDGGDRFYAGLYLGPRSQTLSDSDDTDGVDFGYKISAFTAGAMVGFKWVSQRGILFEIGLGAGRAFGETIELNDTNNTEEIPTFGLDFISRISVGYRF